MKEPRGTAAIAMLHDLTCALPICPPRTRTAYARFQLLMYPCRECGKQRVNGNGSPYRKPIAILQDMGIGQKRMDRMHLIAGIAIVILQSAPLPSGHQERGPRGWVLPRLMVGYGVVNLWHTINAERLGTLLERAGCNLTEIEYVAWFNDEARKGRSVETHVEWAARFVAAMRRHHVVTFINVVNWNGEAQRKQDDPWFLARLREIREAIGPQWVILQAVSEPAVSLKREPIGMGCAQ